MFFFQDISYVVLLMSCVRIFAVLQEQTTNNAAQQRIMTLFLWLVEYVKKMT